MNQREKIIKIAGHLMRQKGYKGASIQKIADLVGIHKTTIFHYFKNKEDLLAAVVNIGIEENIKRLEDIIKDPVLSPEEKLKQAIFNHLELLVEHQDNVTVYHSEIRFLSRKNRKKYLERRKHYSTCFEQLVEEIKETDSITFKGLDARIVTFGILGMLNWAVKWFKKSDRYGTDDIADIFYKMLTK